MLRTRRGGRRRAARLFETAVRGGRYEIEFWAGTIATFRSPASAVPLGTPTGVLQSLKGGGRRAELSERAGQKTLGVSQGGAALLAAFFAYFLSHHRK